MHRGMCRGVGGEERCMKGCMEVQGGGQRGMWRWTESVQRYAEALYRGMQWYVDVQRGLQRYVEVHERYVVGVRRYIEGCADV